MGSKMERRSSVMEYEQSVIFGQYHEKLASFARLQSQKPPIARSFLTSSKPKVNLAKEHILHTLMATGNWPLLFLLGICIAFCSFIVDICTAYLLQLRDHLMSLTTGNNLVGYSVWTAYAGILVLTAAIITRYVSPQAAGSGVAEMKVIIRGVVIKEYLSGRTLLAKVTGIPFILASGLGIGKEGPFVHISSMITNQLFRIFGKVTTIPNEYETRFQELITIASAVGVAATFAAPIGSVLYSIEIVKSFFAVRSYWEGFFAATWGALLWRLFAVWFSVEENISHILLTEFRKNYPYETLEILLFALLGSICGLLSFLFVQFQRSIIFVNRRQNLLSKFLSKFPLAYPLIIGCFVASVKYPGGLGKFTSAHLGMEEAMHELYSNFTWHRWHHHHPDHPQSIAFNVSQTQLLSQTRAHIIHNWSSASTSIFINTFLFSLSNFITIAIASTVPVPGGLIVPLFMLGAGIGRFFGEWSAFLFPNGISGLSSSPGIIPGAYAVAASAALCGGVTGSLSVAVIAFEITGQLTHFLPVIVCVLCSNFVSRYLGPTIYESTIELKNLPFLPTMIKASAVSHRVLVEDFMDTNVEYVWNGCTYRTLSQILSSANLLAFYPFVSSPDAKFLLGIVHHLEIKGLLESHLYKAGLKGLRDDACIGKDRIDPQSAVMTNNGRFQIWSHSSPAAAACKISSLRKELWEEKMSELVDFSSCHIDPAPLQIMEGTPLSNIHNLFSLLSLQVVYVTSLGRLTGVVSLKDLRRVIESVERGHVPSRSLRSPVPTMDVVVEEEEEEEEEQPLQSGATDV